MSRTLASADDYHVRVFARAAARLRAAEGLSTARHVYTRRRIRAGDVLSACSEAVNEINYKMMKNVLPSGAPISSTCSCSQTTSLQRSSARG